MALPFLPDVSFLVPQASAVQLALHSWALQKIAAENGDWLALPLPSLQAVPVPRFCQPTPPRLVWLQHQSRKAGRQRKCTLGIIYKTALLLEIMIFTSYFTINSIMLDCENNSEHSHEVLLSFIRPALKKLFVSYFPPYWEIFPANTNEKNYPYWNDRSFNIFKFNVTF